MRKDRNGCAIYLVHCKSFSQIVCNVLNKWHFHFYLSAYSGFGFFSCVGYLPSKLHIKNIKTLFWDLGVNDMHPIPPEWLLICTAKLFTIKISPPSHFSIGEKTQEIHCKASSSERNSDRRVHSGENRELISN